MLFACGGLVSCVVGVLRKKADAHAHLAADAVLMDRAATLANIKLLVFAWYRAAVLRHQSASSKHGFARS